MSSTTSGFATPPAAGTRRIGSLPRPSNRMTPSDSTSRPCRWRIADRLRADPPAISTFFSLPPAMKASAGCRATRTADRTPSVPGSEPRLERVERADPDEPLAIGVGRGKCDVPAVGRDLRRLGFVSPSGVGSENARRRRLGRTPHPRDGKADRREGRQREGAPRQSFADAAPPVTMRRQARRAIRPARPTAVRPPTSRAVCQRSSGSFARQRDTIRSSAGGVSGSELVDRLAAWSRAPPP